MAATTAAVLRPARAFADERPTVTDHARTRQAVTSFMREHSIPGLSLAFSYAGGLIYQEGFGLADSERKEKVSPSHVFRIASISKPITAVALFTLIERGAISLDSLIFGANGILGSVFTTPANGTYIEQIRLRHLLTHTAGGWQNDEHDPMFTHPAMDHKQLIRWTLANLPLTNPPGSRYAYSNFGYCILGRVIEKLTSRPYHQYVRQMVIDRCGLGTMRIAKNTLAERAPDEVRYYNPPGEDPYNMNVARMDSHGGWLATPTDLVNFATHVDGFSAERNILHAGTILQMTTPTAANSHYAHGWAVNESHNWWHSGSLPGTASVMVRTSKNFCWAAITNFRENTRNTADALDTLMWQLVGINGWKA